MSREDVTLARRPTAKLTAYAILGGVGLGLALVLGRPALAGLGGPFLVALAIGLSMAPGKIILEVQGSLDAARVVESDTVRLGLVVRADQVIDRLDLAVDLRPGLSADDGDRVRGVSVGPGQSVEVDVAITAERWGGYRVGSTALRAWHRSGLFRYDGLATNEVPLRVLPGPDTLDELVPPSDTRAHVGNRPARMAGSGTEFADLRPFAAGDRVRDVNWRVSARFPELWVNQRQPEHSADVVVFLDAFAVDRLADAVRTAALLVTAHLAEGDRVGIVGFGGSLRWVEPGGGSRHRYRLVDALVDTQVFESEADRDLGRLPATALPARALVLALSPLEDPRSVRALTAIAARGADVAVVQLPASVPADDDRPASATARRLLDLERAATRSRFARRGVAVAPWNVDSTVDHALAELTVVRRRRRRRVTVG